MTRRVLLCALLVAAAAIYFVDLGGTSIWDANEAFYTETPREMLEARDLVNPSFNYEPRFNKPVLSYWVVAACYRVFGVSVGVERLPIAVGALVLIACAFVLARLIGPLGNGWSLAGLVAAAGLAVSPRLVMFARRIFIDVWISAFMGLALVFFALSESRPAHRTRYLVFMYVAVGLGTLTKGPVAIVLPGVAFALYLALNGGLRRLRAMMLPTGAAIVVAIVVPWYVALYHQHGWTYITSFLVGENLERYTSGVGFQQNRGALFYVPVVFSDTFPLSLFLVAAAIGWWRARHVPDSPGRRVQNLLWIWIAVIVGFFSFSANKQDLYVFPIVPAVAALGAAAAASAGSERWRSVEGITTAIAALLVALCGAGVLHLFGGDGRVYALAGASLTGWIAAAGGLAVLVLCVWRGRMPALIGLLAVIAVADATFVLRVLPDFERYKPVPEMSALLRSRLQPGDAVVHYNVALPSMVFYLRRHVDMYFDRDTFLEAMRSPRRVYAVLHADDYRRLQPVLGPGVCVIDHRPTFDVKLAHVLRRDPLPELFLVSNGCGK